ncbi:polysaccharide deacetylase family protein [Nonomuraea sp. MCN248]|uniref:Polysaccharide deacetylase family protein n=1 Tax=Nonomuraea corallina TaxID=2989783 RepID=A0ABT4S6A1_9ACTN|nr:polysaccharide deacetylase family protein [Nonomuraea corallina]MDA0632540.1 polysaccharide deacetylase family protein [Nonomuraea corallina]
MLIHGFLVASLALGGAPAATTQAKIDCTKVKCLALTFDDGPGTSTAKLLKILKKDRAKATFFLTGKYVDQRPRLARRTLAEGHAIGNHTYSHFSLTPRLDDEILDDIQAGQQAIKRATGLTATMFRPPFGHTDERVLRVADQLDLAEVKWTGTTLDWSLKDKKKIAAKVLSLAKRDGVILMHDTVPQTVQAMPGVIRELKKQGYHLVTVPQLYGGKLKPGVSYP